MPRTETEIGLLREQLRAARAERDDLRLRIDIDAISDNEATAVELVERRAEVAGLRAENERLRGLIDGGVRGWVDAAGRWREQIVPTQAKPSLTSRPCVLIFPTESEER